VHRTIEISTPASYTDELIRELEDLEQVINLNVVRGGAVKPPGDVLTVHVLNYGADEVMRLADAGRQHGHISVSTAELTSIVDPEREHRVANDVDEALWEEAETGLRHQSRITANYLALMALGGIVGASGLVMEGTSQAITFVAASVIAPGFEPVAKIPIGLALRRWDVARRGLTSLLAGYLALVFSAALVFVLLFLAGVVAVEEFADNPEVQTLADPTLREILVSASGAVAGMVMILSYREYLVPGALIALEIIEAAAMIGVGLVAGELELALAGAGRFGLDVLFIVVGGMLVVLLKQTLFHRRAPMA
jgi:Domain of unknown function (DUF389)